MITILDRYIIRKFLSTFFFTVLIFMMISVIIDFSEKVERFIESEISRGEIIFAYFPNFIVFILGLLWPLFTLISVIFFTSRLANNSEIISILNAGVSYRRFLRPYLISATFLGILYLIGLNYVIPNANQTRLTLERVYFNQNKDGGKTRNVHMFVAPETKIYVNFFRKQDSTARDFRLERFEGNELVYMLKAKNAEWMGPPDNWRLSNYEIRRFEHGSEFIEIGEGKQLDTTVNLRPADFIDYKHQETSMTTPELIRHLNQQRERGAGNSRKYEIELARRSAEPFTIFILTLIGVSVASRKVRGGMGIHLAIGIGAGALFVFLSRFASAISTGPEVPVTLTMWFPNLLFGVLAVFLMTRAQQ